MSAFVRFDYFNTTPRVSISSTRQSSAQSSSTRQNGSQKVAVKKTK